MVSHLLLFSGHFKKKGAEKKKADEAQNPEGEHSQNHAPEKGQHAGVPRPRNNVDRSLPKAPERNLAGAIRIRMNSLTTVGVNGRSREYESASRVDPYRTLFSIRLLLLDLYPYEIFM